MSDNSSILLFYAGFGLSIASALGFYNSKRNYELSQFVKNAPLVSLEDDPSTFLGKDCVVVKGYASVPYKDESLEVRGIKDLIYYRRIVQARSIQVPWSPLGTVSYIPALLLGTGNLATGSIQKPIEREDKKALDWGIRTEKTQTVDTSFLRLPTTTVLNDNDLQLIRETEENAGSPFVSAFLSTIRYQYPYAHLIQEKALPEGSPLMAIGKIEPWTSQGSNLVNNNNNKKYILSTPKFPESYSLFPKPSIVTTLPLFEIQNDLDNSAQKSKTYSVGLIAISLACFAYGLKLHNDSRDSNEK